MRAIAILLVVCLTSVCHAKTDFAGAFHVRGAQIHYVIPAKFVGLPMFTQSASEPRDDLHQAIFGTSYAKGLDGKPAAGLSLGLAPTPKECQWGDDISTYVDYYTLLSNKTGVSAKVLAVTIAGRKWIRILQSFPNGNIARVIYVTKLFDDMNIVFRLGMPDNLNPSHIELDAQRWPEQSEMILQSVVIDQPDAVGK